MIGTLFINLTKSISENNIGFYKKKLFLKQEKNKDIYY